jgi:ABC-type sugar transport system substrate-binding protein
MNIGFLRSGLAAAVIAAGVGAAAQAADKPVYGVLLKTLANPFWGAMEQGIKAGAQNAGVEYFMQAVESETATEAQLNTCHTMLERKPAIMIVSAINQTILLPCLKQATDMKIPVVDLDFNLDHAVAAKAGVNIAYSIGSDNYAGGGKAAEWLATKLGKDAKGPVLVIEGLAGNINGAKRANGFKDALAKLAPGLKVVATLPGDWDRQKAANITNDILTRNPDLVAIFCSNDTMALGAVEAANAAGKGAQMTIVGFDGTTDAVKSIKGGRLAASVAQVPYLVGMDAVEKAKTVLAGGKVDELTYVPTLVLTKQLFDENKDPMLKNLR